MDASLSPEMTQFLFYIFPECLHSGFLSEKNFKGKFYPNLSEKESILFSPKDIDKTCLCGANDDILGSL